MRTVIVVLRISIFVALVLAILWLFYYLHGLRPQHILTLSAAECSHVPFGSFGLAWGRDVTELASKHGVREDECMFALRGRKRPRFKLIHFHAVQGSLFTEKGPPDEVRIYRYDSRYREIVEGP